MIKIPKILIAIIILITAVVIGFGIYCFIFKPFAAKKNLPAQKINNNAELPKITAEQQAVEIKKDYPQIIDGTINFFNTKKSYKATIKTDDGKQYILWPPQPESIYWSFGVKNGQRVEIQGRLNSQGNFEWARITPI